MDGETPCKDWRPVIAGMGASGWELTAIVQTPILVQSSFTTFTIKVLMIFQRCIYKSHLVANQQAMKCYQERAAVTNRYSGHRFAQQAANSNSLPTNLHLSTGLKDDGDDSYYNHTLKRYVRTQSTTGGIPPVTPDVGGAGSASHMTQVGRNSFRKPLVRRMSRSASFSQEGQVDRVPPSPFC